jgi:Zn-finger nucleic acid-binding protein
MQGAGVAIAAVINSFRFKRQTVKQKIRFKEYLHEVSGSEKELELIQQIEEQIKTGNLSESEKGCPECERNFQILKLDNTEIDHCTFCNSLWFDTQELANLVDNSKDLPTDGLRLRSRDSKYNCPVCQAQMEEHVFSEGSNLLVDLCKEHGLYLENGEFERAIKLSDL